MKRKFTAIIAAVLVAVTCITSVSAALCGTCGEILDVLGCTMPNIPGMTSAVALKCTEHVGCEKVYYYADTVTYCTVCQRSSTGVITHRCAIGHRDIGATNCYDVESVCPFW